MQVLQIQQMSFAAGWSTQEIFLAIAIISTLLLGIFFLYRLFSENVEADKQALPKSQFIQLEALSIFVVRDWRRFDDSVVRQFNQVFCQPILKKWNDFQRHG